MAMRLCPAQCWGGVTVAQGVRALAMRTMGNMVQVQQWPGVPLLTRPIKVG